MTVRITRRITRRLPLRFCADRRARLAGDGAGAQVDLVHCSKGWLKGRRRINHDGHNHNNHAGFVDAASLRRDWKVS